MKNLLYSFSILITISCSKQINSKDENTIRNDSISMISTKMSQSINDTTSNKKDKKIIFTTPFDTLISQGNEVLFFRPTEEEFELLVEHYGEISGIHEVEADFSFYAQSVIDSLEASGIKVSVPKQRIIKIVAYDKTVSYLDRLNNGTNEFGVIFNYNDSSPVIVFGVDTDVSILERVKERINNTGYTPFYRTSSC